MPVTAWLLFRRKDNIMQTTQTIAAIATALTNSGIGIIRVSGEDSLEIMDQIFRPAKKNLKLSECKGYTVHYGHIEENGEVIDEVLVMVMRAPHSYTTENTAEIDCHGGVLVMKRILQAVLNHGARLAEPGEFTKRAFLGGRIDLSQAEAVMDLIEAKNNYAMESSIAQLRGTLSEKIRKLREKILYETAFIETALDDPEHISLDGYPEKLRSRLLPLIAEMKEAEKNFGSGRVIREGIKTVILGKPNVGKSSLMNALLGEERAIVTDIAGTTRDTLEENLRVRGISLNIIDTAGIRDTDNTVEKIGVEKARDLVEKADLILYLIDGSKELDDNDREIIDMIRNRKCIVILNKTDLDLKVTQEKAEQETGRSVIPVSAKEKTGIEKIEDRIEEMFLSGRIDFNDEVVITNVRHQNAVREAKNSLEMVVRSIDDGMPEDFFTIDLMNAYEQLGTILGEELGDDLANEIFARFCMGK